MGFIWGMGILSEDDILSNPREKDGGGGRGRGSFLILSLWNFCFFSSYVVECFPLVCTADLVHPLMLRGVDMVS